MSHNTNDDNLPSVYKINEVSRGQQLVLRVKTQGPGIGSGGVSE